MREYVAAALVGGIAGFSITMIVLFIRDLRRERRQ
jgi:hypothetical protein